MNNFKKRSGLAVTALALVLGLSAFGCNSGGSVDDGVPGLVNAGGPLLSREEADRMEIREIQKVEADLAAKKKVATYMIPYADIKSDPRVVKLELDKDQADSRIAQAVDTDLETMAALPNLRGFSKIDFKSTSNKALNYSFAKMPEPTPAGGPQTPTYVDFKSMFADEKVEMIQLKIIQTMPSPPVEAGKPVPPPTKQERVVYYGPVKREEADKQIEEAKKNKIEVEIMKTWPVSFYSNDKGRVAAVVEGGFKMLHRSTGPPMQYYEVDAKTMNDLQAQMLKNTAMRMPRPKAIIVAATR